MAFFGVAQKLLQVTRGWACLSAHGTFGLPGCTFVSITEDMPMPRHNVSTGVALAALAAAAIILPAFQSNAGAITGCAPGVPSSVLVDSQCFSLGASLGSDVSDLGSDLTFQTQSPDGGAFTVSATGIADPQISFSIGVSDFGAASEFAFLFSIPIVPLTGQATVHAELGISLTDANGDGISITPGTLTPNFIMSSNVGNCAAGVDVGTTTSATTPPNTTTVSFLANGVFDPTVGCDSSISVLIDFFGTGNGDNYGLTGIFIITQVSVPEPTSLALIGFALMGLAGAVYRRRKA